GLARPRLDDQRRREVLRILRRRRRVERHDRTRLERSARHRPVLGEPRDDLSVEQILDLELLRYVQPDYVIRADDEALALEEGQAAPDHADAMSLAIRHRERGHRHILRIATIDLDRRV